MTRASWVVAPWVVWMAAGLAVADESDRGGDAGHPDAGRSIRLAAQRVGSGRGLTVRWLGQDGQDHVGESDRPGPDGKQDIHLVLGGLDPRREIAFVDITMPGGHRWQYNPQPGFWLALVQRGKGAASADVWLGAVKVEAGKEGHALVRYDDGTTAEARFRTRKTDPALRVASGSAKSRWLGQVQEDLVGLGPAVGPDGLQDVRIHLSGLGTGVPVKAIRVEAGGSRWEFGKNPLGLNNAEFVKDPKDPRQGDLHFQPDRDLSGARLRISVAYENDTLDGISIAAGRCDPRLRMPQAPLPKVEERPLKARWLGQDGSRPGHTGDVHVVLDGLPSTDGGVAISMVDPVRGSWQYRSDDRAPTLADGPPGTLDVRFRADRRSADVYFEPCRDTGHEAFSVRIVAAGGRNWHGKFTGGPCDLSRLSTRPAPSRAEARPGDDLQALLDRNGTVVLAPGTYRLRRPLVFNNPARLTTAGGATLLFAQEPGDAPWKTALKVRASNTTLEGFAVRFAGPIRWDWSVSYGPAVVGLSENTDRDYDNLKRQVVFRKLDIEAPPVEDPSKWVEAPRLFRLVGGSSGAVIGNRLRGGPIEFFHGPWQVVDNEFRGTPPGTICHGVLTGHFTHDLLIRGNRTSSTGPSGKTWRFLVLTHTSAFDRIEDNVIEGIGSREGDTIPWNNEPEIILTENYSVTYEGRVLAASAGGEVVRTGRPQWSEVRPGDLVAILAGPGAGEWRQVVHVIDPTTFLLDRGLPAGTDAVAISPGFVAQVYEGNRVDLRGSHRSDAFVLPGHHYGTRVVGNHLIGGNLAWRMSAYPSEHPGIWGWTHVPFMGGVVERNILEDTDAGGVLGVDHLGAKSTRGRTYMSAQLRDNVVRWSEPFLVTRLRSADKAPMAGLTLGYPTARDPHELIVTGSGNVLDAPARYRDLPGFVVHAAEFNSQKIVGRKYKLPTSRVGTEGGRREARSSGPRPIR